MTWFVDVQGRAQLFQFDTEELARAYAADINRHVGETTYRLRLPFCPNPLAVPTPKPQPALQFGLWPHTERIRI